MDYACTNLDCPLYDTVTTSPLCFNCSSSVRPTQHHGMLPASGGRNILVNQDRQPRCFSAPEQPPGQRSDQLFAPLATRPGFLKAVDSSISPTMVFYPPPPLLNMLAQRNAGTTTIDHASFVLKEHHTHGAIDSAPSGIDCRWAATYTVFSTKYLRPLQSQIREEE